MYVTQKTNMTVLHMTTVDEAICQHAWCKCILKLVWEVLQKHRGPSLHHASQRADIYLKVWTLEPAYLPDIWPEVQYFFVLFCFRRHWFNLFISFVWISIAFALYDFWSVVFGSHELHYMNLEKCIIFLKIFVCVRLKKTLYTSGMSCWWFKNWGYSPFWVYYSFNKITFLY